MKLFEKSPNLPIYSLFVKQKRFNCCWGKKDFLRLVRGKILCSLDINSCAKLLLRYFFSVERNFRHICTENLKKTNHNWRLRTSLTSVSKFYSLSFCWSWVVFDVNLWLQIFRLVVIQWVYISWMRTVSWKFLKSCQKTARKNRWNFEMWSCFEHVCFPNRERRKKSLHFNFNWFILTLLSKSGIASS